MKYETDESTTALVDISKYSPNYLMIHKHLWMLIIFS